MTSDELDRIRARHADCEPERCEDVHRLLALADRFLCECGHWLDEHFADYESVLECDICAFAVFRKKDGECEGFKPRPEGPSKPHREPHHSRADATNGGHPESPTLRETP